MVSARQTRMDTSLNIALTPAQRTPQETDFLLEKDFFQRHEGLIHGGEAKVSASWRKTDSEHFVMTLRVSGVVEVTCDRCLQPLSLPVEGTQTLRIQLGEAFDDDGETLTVSRRTLTLPLEHVVHELLELSLPYHLCHPAGQCDPQMEAWLSEHTAQDDNADDNE